MRRRIAGRIPGGPSPPQITLPSAVSLPPDVQSPIPGISIASIDGDVNVDLAVSVGTIDPQSVNGLAESINAALAAVQYTPPNGFLGEVTLSVAVFDGPHLEWSETAIQIEPRAPPPAVPSLGLWGLAAAAIALMLSGAHFQRRERP